MNSDLLDLATIFAVWLEPAPTIPALYLFGSRVRGDHRPDSDVDVRVFVNEWSLDRQDICWWTEQDKMDFADLKAKLPGPLAVHIRSPDDADPAILAGRKKPVLTVGRVICVWTPPKAGRIAPSPTIESRP
jgi:Polymerase beta, Nucleotidyltransferase